METKKEKALRKKVYEKPCIVHQQSLEVMAGVCEAPLGKETAPSPCTNAQS